MSTVLPILIPKTKNILLLKDDIGKPKPNTRTLPNANFTYGIQIKRDPLQIQFATQESANEIQSSIRRNHRIQNSNKSLITHGIKNKYKQPLLLSIDPKLHQIKYYNINMLPRQKNKLKKYTYKE
ncbi:unnamed protein product [Paramecium sonneborni]|uniref:Uncharacterized protein n=1 Tax=Paramecium sonneborni TaxID=65129 RepID=A0A8S1RIV5_9CILI|nr:unnamed protein product [Paramecium sonneborni]